MKFIRDLFTGIDGETWDLGRVLLALGAVTMIIAALRVAWTGTFDFIAFGTGFGGLLTGGGALLLMKRHTEPSKTVATSSGPDGNSKATIVTGAPAPGEIS